MEVKTLPQIPGAADPASAEITGERGDVSLLNTFLHFAIHPQWSDKK